MAADFRDVVSVDRVLHEPARLMIAALLFPVEGADFVFLLRETRLTKGNLSSHLGKLEEAGYIVVDKGYLGRVPHTVYRLSVAGRTAFRAYRQQMGKALSGLPRKGFSR
jgi:DNA-binding transcriptional ArsR family regulator